MRIASAQFCPIHEGIKENLDIHYKSIENAALQGVQLLVFPEMSITGYLRETADKYSFSASDDRLKNLQALSNKYNISIIAGAPANMGNKLFISSFIFKPYEKIEIYTKQYLHPGEEFYFTSSFDYHPFFKIDNMMVSPAICADIDHPEHPAAAAKMGTNLYLASIFFSHNGLVDAYKGLSNYSAANNMLILMSNFCGESYGMPAGGRSAFWNGNGSLLGSLDSNQIGLLIVSIPFEKEIETYSVEL